MARTLLHRASHKDSLTRPESWEASQTHFFSGTKQPRRNARLRINGRALLGHLPAGDGPGNDVADCERHIECGYRY
jgi:hypothetical protein